MVIGLYNPGTAALLWTLGASDSPFLSSDLIVQRFGSVLFCSLFYFRAAPAAYGGFQARDGIGAVAAVYARPTATPDPSRICDLQHSSRQPPTLDPQPAE